VLSYLRLMRAPNVLTALADIFLGWLLVTEKFGPVAPLALLLGASAALYLAGMVLNDVFDIGIDRQERPERPLPSGQISLGTARSLGFGLLGLGVLAGALAGYADPSHAALPWRSGAIAVMLAVCVLAYDGGAKRTVIGPLVMGLCRVFNVLLGMSLALVLPSRDVWQIAGFSAPHLLVAGGVGLFIAGVTWFARSEAGRSQRFVLAAAFVVMLAGIALAAAGPRLATIEAGVIIDARLNEDWRFFALVGLIATYMGFRCIFAIAEPQPRQVQAAVKLCLQSLIFIDAAVCSGVREPMFAIIIALLIIPMQILGRWVYST
jgi:4-hydroxybenzoate polyprenyltransferase